MQAGALLGLRHQSVFAGRGKQARVRNSLRACTLFSSGQALRCACSAPFVVVSVFTSCSPRISEWAKKQASMWLPGCRPLTLLRGHSHSPSLPCPACLVLPLIYASTSQEMHRLAVLVHSFLLVGRAGGHNRYRCFHSERRRPGNQSRFKSPGQDR